MLRNWKFIFFGTPEFAVIILEKLIAAGFIPTAVVCNPDRPVGRKKIITPPPMKARIMNYESRIREKIKILQPEKLSIIHDSLFKIQPDFFIIAAYSKIIPKEILSIPRLGAIGVHPSLLPKHRGPTPIQTAILNGDKEFGTTLYLVDEQIDHGPIIAQRKLTKPKLFYHSRELENELAELGADLLIQYLGSPTFQKLLHNIKKVGLSAIEARPQNEAEATYTKKFTMKDAYIEPADLEKAQIAGGRIAIMIDRKIRALNREPGTWTIASERLASLIRANSRIIRNRIKILEAVLTSEGKLKLKIIQFAGKKPVEISG